MSFGAPRLRIRTTQASAPGDGGHATATRLFPGSASTDGRSGGVAS